MLPVTRLLGVSQEAICVKNYSRQHHRYGPIYCANIVIAGAREPAR
jgi:hypothetical protein